MSESPQSDLGVIRPDWILQLNSASEREVAEEIGLKLVKEEVRCVVWNMANHLHCRFNGVPGRACRLLERYFYFLFRSYEKTSIGVAERTALLEGVMNRLMLIIACCVQLSAKMESADNCLSPKVVRVALLCKGIPCTISQIVSTEAEVYSVLGFWIPLWTSVHISEQLAYEIGISSNMMKDVAYITDMADFLRNDVQRKMQWAATGSSHTDGISTVHFCAGAVLTAARLEPICSTQQTPSTTSATESAAAKKLAHLVNAPLPYITCLADIIFETIWNKDENKSKSKPRILKRKK